jgi:hypothetical protein
MKAAYEDRVDRALLYPARHKREAWQSDFACVVRLAITNHRYWISLWTKGAYRLRLSQKERLGLKTPICRLSPLGPGRYTDQLLLSLEDSSPQFLLRVHLRETGQRWLQIRFDAVPRNTE